MIMNENNMLNKKQQIVEREVSGGHKRNLIYFLNKKADQMNKKKF